MDRETVTDTQQSSAPGTLEKFHLGLAADGTICALVFVDERHRSIACIAGYGDLNGFIVSLTRAATEMARRRAMLMQDDAVATDDDIKAVNGSDDDRRTLTSKSSDTTPANRRLHTYAPCLAHHEKRRPPSGGRPFP